MDVEDLAKRLTGVETAVAHLTEAMEELLTSLAGDTPATGLIGSHLEDAKGAFNRVPPPRPSPR